MEATPHNRTSPLAIAAGVILILFIAGAGAIVAMRIASPASQPEPAHTALTPDDLEAIDETIQAARSLLNHNEKGRAEALLRDAADQYPGEQSIHLLHAESLLGLEKFAEALERYEHAIAIGPDHAEYRHAAGTLASELDLHDLALTHYTIAQQLNPTNPKHPLYLAQIQRTLGDTDGARASLVRATRLDPDIALAWGSLAAIALDENRLSVAIGYVQKARALEPRITRWRMLEAKILRREHKPEQAAQLLYAVPEDQRLTDPNIVAELALCLAMMGRTTDAANLYLDAVEATPGDPVLLHETALWLDRDGRTTRAVEYAAAAERAGHESAARLRRALEQKIQDRASAVD